jgi:hypothetical protein
MFKNVKIEATTKTGTQPKLVHHPIQLKKKMKNEKISKKPSDVILLP